MAHYIKNFEIIDDFSNWLRVKEVNGKVGEAAEAMIKTKAQYSKSHPYPTVHTSPPDSEAVN